MHFNLEEIDMPIDTIPADKKVIIYGIGEISDRYTELIVKAFGSKKIAYYVISESHSNTVFHEKKVLSLKKLQKFSKNDYYYIIASFSAVRSMKSNLLKAGIWEENIHETIDFWSVEVMKEIKEEIQEVYFYPQVETAEQLSYFSELIKELPIDDISYHVSLGALLYEKNSKNFSSNFVCTDEIYKLTKKDFVFIWNKDYLFDTALERAVYKFCIDKSVCKSNTTKIINCYLSYLNHKKYLNLSKKNLRELMKSYQGKPSLVFGNGPSLDSFLETSCNMNSYMTVVCNQIFLNEKAMKQINPDVYLLYDQAYFQKENEQVLKNILDVIQNYNCYIIVPFLFIPLLINRGDINKDKMIGIDIYGENVQFITEDSLIVKRMYSVITTLALPFVSYISSDIYFVGCDGKKETENGEHIWSYAATLKEEVESIKYDKIPKGSNEMKLGYEQHCNEFEELINYGENLGKTYSSLTKSYIPVLKKYYKELY